MGQCTHFSLSVVALVWEWENSGNFMYFASHPHPSTEGKCSCVFILNSILARLTNFLKSWLFLLLKFPLELYLSVKVCLFFFAECEIIV